MGDQEKYYIYVSLLILDSENEKHFRLTVFACQMRFIFYNINIRNVGLLKCIPTQPIETLNSMDSGYHLPRQSSVLVVSLSPNSFIFPAYSFPWV